MQILSNAHFFVFWYICWEMSTQRQFDLYMGPDANETDCTQNTLHFYVKFIRKDKHITNIKNLRPKVACSLSRGLQWNDMHSQIWNWTMFNLKNSFPVLLFQSKNWTVSKIRKLSCSYSYQWNFSTDKKARVWLNFEQKARVGPISLRGFSERMGKSSYWWTYFSAWKFL